MMASDDQLLGWSYQFPILDCAEITREFRRRQVLVDHRPKAGIRIAPHFYSSDSELDHTIAELDRIVKGKSFTSYGFG